MALDATLQTALARARRELPAMRDRLLEPLTRHRQMQHPSFGEDAHRSIAAHYDYFRYATLGLAVTRVHAEEIPGAFAEVGVWRGEMSSFIHRLAPERRYYLLDTFAGFPDRDLPDDAVDTRFRDTSVEIVRGRVGDSPNVVIRPGYVPHTLSGLEDEQFAFVLLDLDLYEPTRHSLEFFYPRLATGAYLVVHDYNNAESRWACKRAVDEFLLDKPERVIEIGDVWGSVLLRRLGSVT
jgi:O-methyltransferase